MFSHVVISCAMHTMLMCCTRVVGWGRAPFSVTMGPSFDSAF